MKPIQELTLFDSSREIEDITAFIKPHDSITATIPLGGMLIDDKLLIKETASNQLIAQAANIGNYCSGSESIPIFLRLKKKEAIIVGRLMKLVVKEDEIHLQDFRMLKQGWKNRSEERVQPKHPVYFTFKNDGHEFRASLNDISVKGLCMIANIGADEVPEALANLDLTLLLSLESFIDEFHVKGIIKNYRYLTDSLIRIGVETFPSRSDFRCLSNYIRQRRSEIMEEVFSNFRELLSYRQVSDLRF